MYFHSKINLARCSIFENFFTHPDMILMAKPPSTYSIFKGLLMSFFTR